MWDYKNKKKEKKNTSEELKICHATAFQNQIPQLILCMTTVRPYFH